MRNTIAVLLLVMLSYNMVLAQRGPGAGMRAPGSGIAGKVVDANSGELMEYANIVLFSLQDSSQVDGTITNNEGVFRLTNVKPGSYFLKVSFIGFDDYVVDQIDIKRKDFKRLDEIKLVPHSYSTDDIVVEEKRAPISYEIDKKVINVSENLTSSSGTAVDVLESVPSVTVDIEGNVSLRGSSSFRVLVDGRPSILEPGEILQQIPASSIENIEIVTNPSAKHDPEGAAGFINIILKKNEKSGLSGLLEGSGGINTGYGSQALLDYKKENYGFVVGVDYNHRVHEGEGHDDIITTTNDVAYFQQNSSEMERSGNRVGLRTEFNYNFNDFNLWTIGARYRYREHNSPSDRMFVEWTELDPTRVPSYSVRDRERSGNSISAFSNYILKFAPQGHELQIDVSYESDDGDETTSNLRRDSNNLIIDGRKTTESGPGYEIETKLDYTLQLTPESKFEAGYQNEIDISEENSGLYDYDLVRNEYIQQDLYSNFVKYDRYEHSFYSIYSNNIGSLGLQGGIRAEVTDRTVKSVETNEEFKIDRVDVFPTFHMSYKFTEVHQLMASYTRRINRVRSWELEPFETWLDAYSVRRGNPALKPEMIDSYELGYQAILGKTIFSVESYYRVTHDKREWLRSSYAENITLQTSGNVGQDYSFGTEIMLNFNPFEAWNVNLMGNIYDYRVEGELDGRSFDESSFNYNIRFINKFQIWELTQLQLNIMYNSPSTSAQGERAGVLFSDIALKHEIIESVLSATLQWRDIFSATKFDFTTSTPTYYNHTIYEMESPMISFNLRYTFNSYKQRRGPGIGGGDMDGMSGEDGM